MDRASYLASIQVDTDLLISTGAEALDQPVPTCPGWTCERLVGHIGRVHRWTAGWLTAGVAGQVERAPAGAAVADWARAGLAELLEALAAAGRAADADRDARVSTWAGEQPAIFWPRRMAIEAALHRFDAQAAVGRATPVATALAVDGIDELFAVLLPWRGTAGLGDGGETVHLHATDPGIDDVGGGEWLVTLGHEGLEVERSHAKGDVAVRATASDLLLLLWNRRSLDDTEDADSTADAGGTDGTPRFGVFGDRSLLDRWQAQITF
jgi:uncharacterized protein (TIGR03083 family)